jgi:hypothetical protein
MALAISTSCWSAMERPLAGREQGSGVAFHGGAVDAAQAAPGLAADEEVLGDGEVAEERGFLVDDGDPGRDGGGGIVERDRRTVHFDVSGVGTVEAGEDLDQCRLAGPVLPHQCMRFARMDFQAGAAQGAHRSEGLLDTPQGHYGLLFDRRPHRPTSPNRPWTLHRPTESFQYFDLVERYKRTRCSVKSCAVSRTMSGIARRS